MTQTLTKATFDIDFVSIAWLGNTYEIRYQSQPFLFEGTPYEASEVGDVIRIKFESQRGGNNVFQGLVTKMFLSEADIATYTYELGNDFYRIRPR